MLAESAAGEAPAAPTKTDKPAVIAQFLQSTATAVCTAAPATPSMTDVLASENASAKPAMTADSAVPAPFLESADPADEVALTGSESVAGGVGGGGASAAPAGPAKATASEAEPAMTAAPDVPAPFLESADSAAGVALTESAASVAAAALETSTECEAPATAPEASDLLLESAGPGSAAGAVLGVSESTAHNAAAASAETSASAVPAHLS